VTTLTALQQQLEGRLSSLAEALARSQAAESALNQRCAALTEERDALCADVRASSDELGRLRCVLGAGG
jgi:chromosome segregation ATPase